MAANLEQITVSIVQVLSVATPLVMILLAYIWKGHINEVREHKKELDEQKKSISQMVKTPQLEAMKVNLEHKFTIIENRVGSIEQVNREEIKEIRAEMRHEMNGLGQRLTSQVTNMGENLGRQIEIMGQGFEKQMALIIQHSDRQNHLMIELQKALAAQKGE